MKEAEEWSCGMGVEQKESAWEGSGFGGEVSFKAGLGLAQMRDGFREEKVRRVLDEKYLIVRTIGQGRYAK